MVPMNKKRKTNSSQVDEIKFDDDARQEYLGGFHKRKVARAEHARTMAAKQEKEEKVRERKQLREQRKEDLSKHIAEYNAELRKMNPDIESEELSDAEVEDGEGEAFEGFGETEGVDGQEDAEYVDEDKYTTVTVEAMGDGSDESGAEGDVPAVAKTDGDTDPAKAKKRIWSKGKPDGKAKPKKKKFRYESKTERRATRDKQKQKNSKAASARRAR